MVELIVNGSVIELALKGQEIKYNIQVSDIFDLAKVASSYTNSFQIPKTPNNTQVFEGLGISGDTSSIPYSKIECSLKKDGFTIINKGWLNISETADNYKVSIIDGMIDFFKAIENKTLGVDLDLSNFQHKKDLTNVLASKDNEYYTYIFADYGGFNLGITGTLDWRILIDYQVPSFSVRKLFDLMISTFGFTWESERMKDFIDELWITYPTPPTYVEGNEDLIATLNKGFYSTNKLQKAGNLYFAEFEQDWDSSTIIDGELIDNRTLIVPESSGYKIKIKIEAYLLYKNFGDAYNPAKVYIYSNGNPIFSFETDPFSEVEKEFNVILNEGDEINYLVYSDKKTYGKGFDQKVLNKIVHKSTVIEIKKIDQGEVSLTDGFKNFKINDFFKEILWRTGLIPKIKDNHITFYHVDELIDFNNAIDWSDKFIVRKKETYLKSSYAQKNFFKMKYNDGQIEDNDGVINVNNKNISEERTLAQSVIYSPINKNGFFFTRNQKPIFVPTLQMYVPDFKENEEDTSYKTLDNRFYFLRKKNISENLGLVSYEIPADAIVTNWNFASIENTLLGELVNKNFKTYSNIFNNFKAHEIELNISLLDVLKLDFTRPYYIKKEGQYYILNKITFQSGETSVGEFIRINK